MAEATKTSKFDPRITPARGDLAAKHLPALCKLSVSLREKPTRSAARKRRCEARHRTRRELLTEALKGERITIYEIGEKAGRGGNSPAMAMSVSTRQARFLHAGRLQPIR